MTAVEDSTRMLLNVIDLYVRQTPSQVLLAADRLTAAITRAKKKARKARKAQSCPTKTPR